MDAIIKSELELLRNLAEAEEDVQAGRVASMQESFDSIRTALKERQAGRREYKNLI